MHGLARFAAPLPTLLAPLQVLLGQQCGRGIAGLRFWSEDAGGGGGAAGEATAQNQDERSAGLPVEQLAKASAAQAWMR